MKDKRPPLRAGIEEQLPVRLDNRGKKVPAYPSAAREANAIRASDFTIYEIEECPEYRCLIADDPRKQYKVLLLKEKSMPGIMKGDVFWSPIRANAQTGPMVMGFDDALLAMAFAQDWLKARVQGKLRTEAARAAFIRGKRLEKENEKLLYSGITREKEDEEAATRISTDGE